MCAGVAASFVLLAAPALAAAAADPGDRPLSAAEATVLGVVEGATEFLPVSSTGHLVVAEHLMRGHGSGERGDVDSFLIVVQGGAIAAVLLLYRRRIWSVVEGVRRAGPGRQLGFALVTASVPALLVGALAGDRIKDRLLEPLPVGLAWIAGGCLILVVARWYRRRERRSGDRLDALNTRTALLIGIAQVAALWPGVSRSLVTILAAVALGLSVPAAVEFSFLLGAVVLSAATASELLLSEAAMAPEGWPIAAGMTAAFGTGVLAVRWMVSFLEHRDISIFGWYRVAVGAVSVVLVASGWLAT